MKKIITILGLLISAQLFGQTSLLRSEGSFLSSGTSFLNYSTSVVPPQTTGFIVADHSVVDLYDNIPQQWIDSVKTMWVSYAGESHSEGVRAGALLLEASSATYAVSVVESGTPESYTTSNLRLSRATWGDLNNSSGWIYGYGEEDWYTSSTAIARTKAGLQYCNTSGPALDVLGFGWCWDPAETDMTDYLSATQEFIDYCITNGFNTKVIFTTGPVDSDCASGEVGYLKSLAYASIRDYVAEDSTRILFDYADILCYDDDGTGPNTETYNSYTFPIITSANLTPTIESYHISEVGAVRIAKAMWWLLARIAGWDGN